MRETRTATLTGPEVRKADSGELQFTGHAAVFGQRTWIGPKRWGFYEQVDPGFFRDVLDDDAAFLVNHDPNIVLARNGTTMSLSTDKVGLVPDARWSADDPEASMWAGRVKRGDVSKMSFSFDVAEDKWEVDEDTGVETRTLLTASRLYDVSLVTYPAYDGTDAAIRSAVARAAARKSPESMRAVVTRLRRAVVDEASQDPRDVLIRVLGMLQGIDSIADQALDDITEALGLPDLDEDPEAGPDEDDAARARARGEVEVRKARLRVMSRRAGLRL